WKHWWRWYLPAEIGELTGPSWSLMPRFSPPATECAGAHRLTSGVPGSQTMVTQAFDSSAEPLSLWPQHGHSLRSRPMTRPSTVTLAYFRSALSKLTSKH